MMSDIGDLVAHLSIDTSEFITPIIEAADAAESAADLTSKSVGSMSAAVETSGERVARVVHEQEGSWLSLATAAVPAVATITSAVLGYAATMASISHQKTIIAGISSSWSSAGAMLLRFGGIANTVARTFIPQWRIAGLVVTGALLSYKFATSEMGQNAVKAVGKNGAVAASIARLKTESSKLGDALSRPFKDLSSVAGSALQNLVENYSPLPAIARMVGSVVSTGADLASTAIQTLSDGVTTATDRFTGLALAAAAGEWDGGSKYIAEAQSLRALAAETERVMAIQNSHRSAYKMLGDLQRDSAAAAGRAEEVAAVGALETAAAIDEARSKYQQLFAQQIQALRVGEQLSAGQMAHMKNVIEAIEKQSAAVATGRVHEKDDKPEKAAKETPFAQAYDQATESLNKLKYGQEEAALMALRASGANEHEIESLQELQVQIASLTEAQKQQEHTDQLFKAGTERIESMRDEIDKLSGAATAAEVEMRKLTRAGHTQEQIEEIGRLAEQLEGLKQKEEKTKDAKDGKAKSNKAMFAGSSETASLILRGVGGGGKSGAEKVELDSYVALKQIVKNTKSGGGKTQVIVAGKISGY